jgi:hypothetical protein
MTNPNDNKSYCEVHQDSYTESDGNTYTSVTRTSETVDNSSVDPNSYESGHVRGRTSERNYQEHRLAEVYEDNASGGFLLGLLLVLLAGLTVGAVWFFTQRDETRNNSPASTVTVTPTQTPQSQTKIIERTKEVAVPVERTKEVPIPFPVPQQNSSPPTVNTTPNINITVPSQRLLPNQPLRYRLQILLVLLVKKPAAIALLLQLQHPPVRPVGLHLLQI